MYAEINETGVLELKAYTSTEMWALNAWREKGAQITLHREYGLTATPLVIPMPEAPKADPIVQVANTPQVDPVTPVQEAVAPDDTLAQRDSIKKELTVLGVPFNNKARTEVLAKLLEDTKTSSAKTAATAPSVESAPALPTQPEASSIIAPLVKAAGSMAIEVVREAVKKYAAIKGAPKAMELLAKYKANKVSELPEASYAEVVEFVAQETK
jgi:hypothetical protein